MDDCGVCTNFSLSSFFENSYTTYGLIAITLITLITIAYIVYKYYLYKNSYIGSTDVDSLQNYQEENYGQQQHPENYGQQPEESR
jgi:hypothetical protein